MDASDRSGSKADAVVARLGEILQEVDMSITTQRQVTNKLAEELGEDVYEYKALIRVSNCTEQQAVLLMLMGLNDGVTSGQAYRIMSQGSLPAMLLRKVQLRPSQKANAVNLSRLQMTQMKLQLAAKGSGT